MTTSIDRFDLLTEPWVPAVDLEGDRRDVGLRDLLVQAHDLGAIADPSPLVEIALFRLLVAVLHRVINGPRSPEEWQSIWSRGRFDEAAVDGYFRPWADRFDLLDRARPFYQTPGLVDAGVRPRPIVRLTHELASEGNAALLFDHATDAAFTPAQAARYLVAQQTFALGGTVTRTPGSTNPSAKGAPAAQAVHFRVRGRTLFETLVANLVRYDPAEGIPVATVPSAAPDDRPAWEHDGPPNGASRQPTGYLDVLTWQSRRVELVRPEADGLIRNVVVLSGERIAPGRQLSAIEPTFLAFVPSRSKTSANELREVRLSADRALWRDSTVLLAQAKTSTQAAGAPRPRRPGVLDWVADLALYGFGDFPSAGLLPLEAGGLVADRDKTLLWRRESLAIPLAALVDENEVQWVKDALAKAERVGAVLGEGDPGDATLPRPLARLAIGVLGAPDRPPRPDAIRAFVTGLGAGGRYWSALATGFATFLADLAHADSHDDPDRARAAAAGRWDHAVRSAARDAFSRAVSGLGGSPRVLFAVGDAERAFQAGLARAMGSRQFPKEVVSA